MPTDLDFLQMAIDQAKESVKQDGFPAGSVLVKDGKVVAKGLSIGFNLHDPTAHSDIACIRAAAKKFKTLNLEGAVLYSSLQPCMMCFSASIWSGLSRIVYAAQKTAEMVAKDFYEGKHDLRELNQLNNRQIKIEFIPDLEAASLKVVEDWENNL